MIFLGGCWTSNHWRRSSSAVSVPSYCIQLWHSLSTRQKILNLQSLRTKSISERHDPLIRPLGLSTHNYLSLLSPSSAPPPSSFVWAPGKACLALLAGPHFLRRSPPPHFRQHLPGPGEADALNKMTTVICLCHSGRSRDYTTAQKYSAREGGRMCVSVGFNSLFFFFFFLFSRELPFPLSPWWQVYLKPATTPPLIHTALPSLWEIRN